ncbi:hypothetical protein JMJ35_006551 [Cladonia borealis]|uniref:Uncharacterized protein n=1 Tax=Cladonia borealis TaxID=184061 RepID=A0AA39QZ85_9LECA|nr:hypothetical protein JMJ35_006551 [Cladonia borealis]
MFSLVVFLPLVMVSAFSFDIVTNKSIPDVGSYSWSTVIQLNNSTQPTLSVPPAPPAFTADMVIDATKPLSSKSVYLVAVEAMYTFAQVRYDKEILTQTRITQTFSDVSIIVENVQSAGAIDQLENSHVIEGLYRGIVMMIERSWWCEAIIGLNVHGTIVGYITILGPQQGAALNSTAAIPPAAIAAARSLEARSRVGGRCLDREDPFFQLDWTHETESSTGMAQEAIYTAVLSGLADAALHDPGSLTTEVNAMGPVVGQGPSAYRCDFHISIDPDDGYQGPLTYYLVTKTFRDVAGYIMTLANWYGEYTIDLYYQGQLIAYAEVAKIIIN